MIISGFVSVCTHMMHGKRELMALHIYEIIIISWKGVDYYLDLTFSFSV